MKTVSINISGMSCGHCSARVEKALSALDGVASAVVILAENRAEVSFDESKTDQSRLDEAITDAGYDVVR